ncbi:MAG: septum formation initiator family protein [Bacteroidaceae bacterium]|nr:septum formation initiator family protein [Bacteroidaceae bacterium]
MSKIHSVWLFMRRHKYLLTILIIVLIVGVVDEDSFLNRHPRRVRIDMLRQEIANYKHQYDEADSKIRELENNPKAVEKIARERYHMKRANEDVFVFVGEEEEVTQELSEADAE